MSKLPSPQRSWAIRQIIALVEKNKREAVPTAKHSAKIITLNDLNLSLKTQTQNESPNQ